MKKDSEEFAQALNPQNHTILIIDDESANLAIVADYLVQSGFQIKVTQTGEVGLELARRTPPDLILLDVRLPGIDGFEVCRRLKAEERTRQIPVIFMTVLTRVADKVKGFEVGGMDYISKPFQKEEVLARVTTHLHLRNLTQALEEANKGLELRVAERTKELAQTNAKLKAEITKRKQAQLTLQRLNRELRAISNCNQMLIRITDEQTLLNEICRIICDEAGYRLAWVGYVEHNEAKSVRPVAWSGFDSEYVTNVNMSWNENVERGQGPGGVAIRTGRRAYIEDFSTDPHMALWREAALQRGYRSFISLPLQDEEKTTFGILNIYSTEPNAFTPGEIRLLEELAGDMSLGIEMLRSRIQRKQVEVALRESEQRYRLVFENSPISIGEGDFSEVKRLFDGLKKAGITDIETHFSQHPETIQECVKRIRWLDVNQASLELYAAANKDELLAGLVNTFTPETFHVFRAAFICLWNGGTEMVQDTVIKTLTGDLRNVTVYLSVCPGYEHTLSKILVSLTDITERKQAEDEIARSLEAERKARQIAEILREANVSFSRTLNLDDVLENLLHYLRHLVPYDSANVMLLESDFWLRVAAINGYEHWTNADLTRQITFDLRTTPVLNEIVTTQKSVLVTDTRAYDRWVRPPGAEHVISWIGVPIIAGKQVIGVYSIDKAEPGFFTEDHRHLVEGLAGQAAVAIQNARLHAQIKHTNIELEQRVFERTAQLQAANKELEAFAYSVSHDLRAPLRHIGAFLELLRAHTETSLDEQSQHYMDIISASTHRMGVMIEDLLAFSRMGRSEMAKAQINLGRLVQEVLREFEPDTEGREVHWQIGPLPTIVGDRAMLRLVLENLISNALKFTRSCSPAKIEVGWNAGHAAEVVIFVRDNGVGFDMDYAGKLFRVFERLHRADEFEGTGIGLANVRRIIERHGGKVWAEAYPGLGATFYFSLPQLEVISSTYDAG